MPSNIKSVSATDVPETTVPAQEPCLEKPLLREVAEVIVADSRVAPDEYLEEVRVAVGGE